MKLRLITLFSVLFLALLAGCATKSTTASVDGGKKEEKEEYVTLPPATGSNLPRRVKKSDLLAGKVPDAGNAQQVDKDEFARSLRPGRAVDKGN
ncbi:MAG: hypothetical protein HYV95_06705 [Opitutae bacterium]|nr:hypothetical protein [Opitutae bacterium]